MAEDKLNLDSVAQQKPWMKHIGKLKDLRGESKRINEAIEEEFEKVEPEMWEPDKRN